MAVGVLVTVGVGVNVAVTVVVGVGVLHSNSTPFTLKTLVLDTLSIFDRLTQLTSDIFVITPIITFNNIPILFLINTLQLK